MPSQNIQGSASKSEKSKNPDNFLADSQKSSLKFDTSEAMQQVKKLVPSLLEQMGSRNFVLRLTNFSNASFASILNKNRRRPPSQSIPSSNEYSANKKNLPSKVTTRPYRAPEIILGLNLTPNIDVYSMGCIFFELYCKKLLFDPVGSQDFSRDEDHLAQILELRVLDQDISREDLKFLKSSPRFSVIIFQ